MSAAEDAEKRGCYCNLWDSKPEHFASRGVPQGFCGLCEKCGKPGHIRHFPGAVPFTGSWCDRHHRMAAFLHPLGNGAVLFYILAGAAWALWRHISFH